MGEDVRDFVFEIYDTVVDASRWPAVLDKFADMVGALGCIVFEWEGHGAERRLIAPLFSSRFQGDLIDGYLKTYHELEAADQDRFEARSLAADSIDLIGDSILADSEQEYVARANVQALLEFGIRHRSAGLLNKDNTARSRFSVQYSARHGPPSDGENSLMAEVLPHIAKALDLGRPAAQLSEAHRSLVAAMDRLRIGVCILDGRGNVVLTNKEFQRQREAYGAFRINANGRLRLHNGADQRRFADLMSDALNHGRYGARPRKEAIATTRDSEISALCIEIAPLDQVEDLGSDALGGSILYSIDTNLPIGCDAAPLRRAFGLTDAEASLAEMLGEGFTNAQIAERRSRSVETVNVQVKSLLAKTQAANRTQFARLMMNFGVNFLVPGE